MKNETRTGYLLKNTMIFTIGNISSKLISFFLIPLYTLTLNTTDYGIVDLVTTIITVAVPLITLNVGESVMRFSLDKNADKDKISKIGSLILLYGGLFSIVFIPILMLFPKISKYSFLIYFYIIFSAASNIYLCDLRGKELLIQYSVGNIFNTLLIAVFNLIFLLKLNMGITGYLLAYIFSNMIISIYAIAIGKSYKAFFHKEFDKRLMKKMLKYSVVLIPNSFMWWIMNSSDRLMVSSMVSIAANGIYAVSYKLPTQVSTFTNIFNQAWSYSAIREEGANDEEEYNNKIFKVIIGFVMLVGIAIISFNKPFLRVYVTNSYYSAWKYVPLLTIGCVYLTLGTFMATSYTVHKDSFGYLFSSLLGAIFNIIMNFILIPQINVYGAAIATCLSYILVFLFRLIHTRKYLIYNIKNFEFVSGTVLLLVDSLLTYKVSVIYEIIQIFILVMSLFVLRKSYMPLINIVLKKIKL